MARIIDGAAIGRAIRAEVKAGVEALVARGVRPGLAVVLVGHDPASAVYVRMKARACRENGIHSRVVQLPDTTTQDALFTLIDALNADPAVHGILVQLPLPGHLPPKPVLERVHPTKDVDGFHPLNAGRAFIGDPRAFVPATTAGILELLRREEIPLRGRHVVVVGRSLIVSKPLMSLLVAPGVDATVTLVHRHTGDIAPYTRQADVLVVAVGKPGLIRADMVRPGAVVVDVGITKVTDPDHPDGHRIVGDVDFAAVREVAGAITPVPGGVGPMTIAMLLVNTLRAAQAAVGLAHGDPRQVQ